MLIKRGAEAEIHLEESNGRKVILKKRLPKSYRVKEVDDVLRKERTKSEAKLISEARRAGVSTPIIFDIDLKNCCITMEYIDGKRIKDFLNDISESERRKVCLKIGESIARLHNSDIIHGDLTTSNMILKGERIYFFDFGLGERSSEIEAKGVDLHVLMEAFESTHSQAGRAFDYVLDAYERDYKEATKTISKMKEIISRGRYT